MYINDGFSHALLLGLYLSALHSATHAPSRKNFLQACKIQRLYVLRINPLKIFFWVYSSLFSLISRLSVCVVCIACCMKCLISLFYEILHTACVNSTLNWLL